MCVQGHLRGSLHKAVKFMLADFSQAFFASVVEGRLYASSSIEAVISNVLMQVGMFRVLYLSLSFTVDSINNVIA